MTSRSAIPPTISALRDWYRGRRVLVTGHTGFKGAWLVAWLEQAGASVSGFALPAPSDRRTLFTLTGLAERIESTFGDVRDRGALDRAMLAAKPEIVIHLAAQALVRRSYADPVGTFDTNVIGTAQLLDAVRQCDSVRAVVVVTSDKCYENLELERGYREDDPLGGHDPYSASKSSQEIVTSAFRRSFLSAAGIATATARAGNMLGGGDWSEDRLITNVLLAADEDRPYVARNPDAVRPWQYVLEPLRGYLMLARALAERGEEFAEPWNFGPNPADAVTVRELVARLTAAWPRLRSTSSPLVPGLHETKILRLDSTKSAERLGWRPALTLDETVSLTVDWYRQLHDDPTAAPRLVREQLLDYERRVSAREESEADPERASLPIAR